MLAVALAPVGMGSVGGGYGEAYLGDQVGDEDRDWNSGEEICIGCSQGISSAIRRCKASFWAESSMYFCIDSCLLKGGLDVKAIVVRSSIRDEWLVFVDTECVFVRRRVEEVVR
jgi:hypothetical protein